ncbi:MAG TPA: hypothetical protein VIS73_01395 [Rhodocyclaceae bacterium]
MIGVACFSPNGSTSGVNMPAISLRQIRGTKGIVVTYHLDKKDRLEISGAFPHHWLRRSRHLNPNQENAT